VAPRLFRSQLDYLTRKGWQEISLADAAQRAVSDLEPEADEFAITFDDGYLSVYEHACPMLAGRNMTATIFVVADQIGGVNEWDRSAGDTKEPMMSGEQIRELAANGFEIGAHTLTHPRLTELDDERVAREISDSKHRLEDLIGSEVSSFSYPYGDCDERVIEAAVRAGYQRAVGTKLGVVARAGIFEIPRVNVRWNSFGGHLMRKIGRARHASGTDR
jgi:peptidoglycan/xylan/chitin deacetylase (PgdA/CDA1 family)